MIFKFHDGFSVTIVYSNDKHNDEVVFSPGSYCKIVARSRLNKKLTRQGYACIFTGKYRTYNTETYYQSSSVVAQVRFLDGFCKWVALRHIQPLTSEELDKVTKSNKTI